MISRQIEVLLSAYRKADYQDPDGFMTQLAIVLSKYPDEVILEITSPETGIQRTHKWPPSIAEVVEVAEATFEPIKRRREREERERERARVLPAPRHERTPEEQARIDKQVADWRSAMGIPEKGLERR